MRSKVTVMCLALALTCSNFSSEKSFGVLAKRSSPQESETEVEWESDYTYEPAKDYDYTSYKAAYRESDYDRRVRQERDELARLREEKRRREHEELERLRQEEWDRAHPIEAAARKREEAIRLEQARLEQQRRIEREAEERRYAEQKKREQEEWDRAHPEEVAARKRAERNKQLTFLGVCGLFLASVCYCCKPKPVKDRLAELNPIDVSSEIGPMYDKANNGKYVFATGQLTVKDPCYDYEFQVFPANGQQPLFKRKVDVYCWTEEIIQVEERKGDMVRKGSKAKYTPKWVEQSQFPASSSFRDKNKLNIRPTVSSRSFESKFLNIGPVFTVHADQARSFMGMGMTRCPVKREDAMFPVDSAGQWISTGKGIARQVTAAHETIGDLRVTYEGLQQFSSGHPLDVTIVAKQQADPENPDRFGLLTDIQYVGTKGALRFADIVKSGKKVN